MFLGDGGYASHEFARFFHRHRRRAALVSRFLGSAALYDPPPKYRGSGRPRVKGRRRKSPEQVVAAGRLKKMAVDWYSGTKRHQPKLSHRPDCQKSQPTFADAIAEVRRLFWTETIFQEPYLARAIQKVPPKLKNLLLDSLCQAI